MAIDWEARIKAAEAKRDAAKNAISAADRAELDRRAKFAEIEAERLAFEAEERELGLARRLDAMRESMGEDALLESLSIAGRPDTFILTHDAAAHAKWERDTGRAPVNSKLDPVEITRTYAVAVVVDWNGITNFDDTTNGHALIQHLKQNPGMATAIVNKATRLAGLFAEERKS